MTVLIESLAGIVGEQNVLTGDARQVQSGTWENDEQSNAAIIVRPASTGEVSAVMRLCFEQRQTVVPYGGRTNLVQGCASTPNDLGLSFAKMNTIENIDVIGCTMTAQAGVTMLQAQEHAERDGLYFPVDIGARDTCMLGGNIATNAGGTKVIRHGMMRASVLGLEVVLADGTVLDSMNRFLKNNSGFDLKQLFIGSEGVLGLVTRAVLRLDVQPTSHNVALLACRDFSSVLAVLQKSQHGLGQALCGFEVMWDNFVHNVVQPVGRLPCPIAPEYPYYVIVESMGTQPEGDEEVFTAALLDMMENGEVADGAIAKSGSEREAIWAIRHEVEWVVRDALVFDVSVPIDAAEAYVETITRRVKAQIADARIAAFGHLGDNNIHISVLSADRRDATAKRVQAHIYESLLPYKGAISAEHGIGLEKRDWLPISRTSAEIEMMRTLKGTLDPRNILNPGKVIAME